MDKNRTEYSNFCNFFFKTSEMAMSPTQVAPENGTQAVKDKKLEDLTSEEMTSKVNIFV